MSLEQAKAFYQSLHHDTALYAQYLLCCCRQTPLPEDAVGEAGKESLSGQGNWKAHWKDGWKNDGGDRAWNEAAIIKFAAAQGYCFGLSDLYHVWFGRPDYRSEHMEQASLRLEAIIRLNRQLA